MSRRIAVLFGALLTLILFHGLSGFDQAQADRSTQEGTLSAITAAEPATVKQPGIKLDWEVHDEQFQMDISEASGARRAILSEDALIMHSALMQLAPNGQHVAFVTARDLGFRDAVIWLMDSSGAGRRRILESGTGYWISSPLWSPDSRHVAYIRVSEDTEGLLTNTQLWLYDLAQDKTWLVVDDRSFAPPLVAGAATGLIWDNQTGLQYTDPKTGELHMIDMATGQMLQQPQAPRRSVDLSGVQACRGMVKPVPVRTYDGSIGNGYTTAYLDKYTYTTWEGFGSHPGVDIAGGGVTAGTSVVAAGAGHVERADWGGSWGNLVILRHDGDGCDGTVYSIYAHMRDRPTVSGDISSGAGVGNVGSTGNSTGAHLHFQVDKDNTSHPYWPSRAGQCTSCTWDNPNNVVNNPDTDNIVKNRTHSPMRFVQDRAGGDGGGQQPQNCADGEGVVLYEHSSYQGRCTRLTGDDPDLSNNTIGNDAASSIKVIGNFQATVYEHTAYTGVSSQFTGDDPDFGNDTIRHDRATSIRVSRRDAGGGTNCDGGQGAYLYEHGNYQGRCTKFTGDSASPGGWYLGNDAASSIRFVGNYEATVYQHSDYQGTSTTFTSDDADFGNNPIGHDQVSSIRVRTRSTGGGTNCDGGQGAYLYEHGNYQGRCTKFTGDSASPGGWYLGNDAASSIRFVGNYEATVYQHDNYQGTSTTFTGDDPDFGNNPIGHDQVSSIRVRTRSSGPTSCADGQFLAEYFNNRNLSGSPTLRRCEASINADWGTGGPGNGVGNDNFSVRWAGNFWFDQGLYRFATRTDDGVRLWVDSQALVNEWRDMGATVFTRDRTMTAGMHAVRMEYYENGGGAVARLTWQRQQQAAQDPDDGRPIGYNQGIDGTINPARDRDDYYFEGSAGQAITIRLDKRDSSIDPYVELYNPDGTLLGQDDDNGGNTNSRLAINLRQNGRHKIIAREYGSGTGGYRLSLSQESVADPDDNRWITLGGSLQGTISPNNDRDWYFFSGVAGRAISIRMNKIDSGLDSYLELYNEGGAKVIENDDGGGDRNSWIVYTLPAGGTYRILARSYGLASSGRYHVSISSVSTNNLARGRSATATSTEFSGVEPYKAFDGNMGTRWSSQFRDPQLIYVNLGSAKTFNQVVLRWEAAFARRYGIFYWTGSEWRQLFWTDNGDGGVDTINFAPTRAQYVGMYGIQRGTQYGYSLWEFEVYDNTALVLPTVPPDPEDKPSETGVDPVTPLAPNDPGKETLLIGEGEEGQENTPLEGLAPEAPTGGTQTGLPSAFILYPQVDPEAGEISDPILFQGLASDNDEDGESIVEYRWTSNLDGPIGSEAIFTRPRSSLQPGQHVITFQVRDNEGDWSEPVTTTLTLGNGSRIFLPVIVR